MRARSRRVATSSSGISSSEAGTPAAAATASRASVSQASISRMLGQRSEPGGQLVQAPGAGEGGRRRPGGLLIANGRERGGGVDRCDSPVQAQVLRLGREAPRLERGLEGPVLAQDVRRLLGADARRARKLVGRIPAQRDEI